MTSNVKVSGVKLKDEFDGRLFWKIHMTYVPQALSFFNFNCIFNCGRYFVDISEQTEYICFYS